MKIIQNAYYDEITWPLIRSFKSDEELWAFVRLLLWLALAMEEKAVVVAVDIATVVVVNVVVISPKSEFPSKLFFKASLALNSSKRLSNFLSSMSQMAGQTDNRYRITEGHILIEVIKTLVIKYTYTIGNNIFWLKLICSNYHFQSWVFFIAKVNIPSNAKIKMVVPRYQYHGSPFSSTTL